MVLSLEGLTVLIEQDLPSGGCSAPVIAITMGKSDNKALTLSVGNWSGLVRRQPNHNCFSSTMEPGYNSHPWDRTSWLLYRGDLLMR